MLGSPARLGLALLVAFVFVLFPRASARADAGTAHSASVAVLAFDSDDAEEQADALTAALRSRIRASQGWSLTETSQSLGMLTAALRCPGKPIPADCEQRIGEQIKSERYIFGYVSKGPQTGQVTAEIHLYQKNKPDTVIREAYADNLRDQNDDTLRKIAQRVLDRLGGTAVGTIIVKMGSESGEVIVDGDKRVPLQNGTARLELAPGGHSVEVVANGQPPQKRNVLVNAGKETIVDLQLAASNTGETPKGGEKPFPTRKVIGVAMAVVGVGLGVFALTRFLEREDLGDQFTTLGYDKKANYNLPAGQTEVDPCATPYKTGVGGNPPNTVNKDACDLDDKANTQGILALVSAGAGALLIGGGAYLFFSGGSDEGSSSKTTGKKKNNTTPRITPMFGLGQNGLSVSGRF